MGYVIANGVLAALMLCVNVKLFGRRKQPFVLFTMGWNVGMVLCLLMMIMATYVSMRS